jgi:hypothetical protein
MVASGASIPVFQAMGDNGWYVGQGAKGHVGDVPT